MKKRYYLIPFMLLVAGFTLWFLERDTVKEVQTEHEEHNEHNEDDNNHEHGDEEHNESGDAHKEHEDDTSESHAEHGHEEHADHEEEGGHGHEESTGGVGPDNAVIAAAEDKGIKLSDKAAKAIGLKTLVLDGTQLPASALVYHQDQVSAYWVNEGWYKRIPANKLEAGDTVVVSGTALLRLAELDAFSAEVGHGH